MPHLSCTLAGIQQLQGIDPNIANWAFTQAAASLGPAVLQLVAPHIQQRIQLEAPQLLAEQKGKLHAQINEQQANLQLKVQAQQSLVQASAPEAVQDQQVIKGDQASAFTELKQAYDRHMKSLGFHLSEADDVSSIQNRTSQVGVLVSQMESSSYPSGSLTDTKPPQSTPKQELPSVLKEAPPLLPVKAPASLSLDVATLSPQPPATPRTDEDKEGGTALMGFLSSLRRSYEDVLRAKETFESEGGIRNLDRLSEVSSDRASGYSESSFDSNLNCQSDRAFGSNGSAYNQNTNYRAAINDFSSSQTLGRAVSDWNSDKEKTDPSSCEDSNSDKDVKVTDSSSQQRGSSVEDSDWNSDKKTDPLSSEDSDKEVNERRRRNYSKGPPRKRMKIQRVADEIRKGPTS